MPKANQTPASVLLSLMEQYQVNPFCLSKDIKINYQTVLNILKGKGRVTVQTALKLSKYFGQDTLYWINVQTANDITKLSKNKKFTTSLNSIKKAKKPTGKIKKAAKPKAGKRKVDTLAEKRKKAAKVPGVKPTRRTSRKR